MSALLPLDRLSRRRFVYTGVASLVFPTTLARAQSGASDAPLNPPPSPEDAAKIAAESDAARHLAIDVKINGQGPFRFVVDTGADRTVLAEEVAVALNLVRGKKVVVEGIVLAIDAETVAVNNLTFGSIEHEHLVLPVVPRALLQADGYLGLDVIDGYRVTLDFKNKELEIEQPRHSWLLSWNPPRETRVPVMGSQGHLRAINARVDGIITAAFIDTGAEISVGNQRLLEALVERDPSYFRKETVTLNGVTGGTIDGRLAIINKISMHGLMFIGCNVAIANLQIFDLWGLNDRPALLIGMNFLRSFSRVSIDYGRKEIRFDLARLMVAQQA